MKTLGISPKVIADLIVSVVSFAVLNYGASLDPEVAALIGKTLGTVGGVFAGPGTVVPKT